MDKSGNIQAKLNGTYSTLRSGMYDFKQIALWFADIVAFPSLTFLPLCFGSGECFKLSVLRTKRVHIISAVIYQKMRKNAQPQNLKVDMLVNAMRLFRGKLCFTSFDYVSYADRRAVAQ